MCVWGGEGYEGMVVVGRSPWEGWKVTSMREMEERTVVLPPNICELPEGKLRDYAKMIGTGRDLEVDHCQVIAPEEEEGTYLQQDMSRYCKVRLGGLQRKDDEAWFAIRKQLSNANERVEYLKSLEAEVKQYLIANHDRALREWMKEFEGVMLIRS